MSHEIQPVTIQETQTQAIETVQSPAEQAFIKNVWDRSAILGVGLGTTVDVVTKGGLENILVDIGAAGAASYIILRVINWITEPVKITEQK